MTTPNPTRLLDTKLINLFDLLYTTRSVTRAAEQLGQSQPTISIWLGRLRRELNDPLFVRTPDGMQPTPRAESLIPLARQALAALSQLGNQEQPFEAAISTRRFCIAMTDASHANLLPPLLAHVRAMAPGVRLAAVRIDAQTGERLQSGEADLALGYVPELGAGFYQQSLFTQDWICLVNARHPRLRGQLSLDDYAREGHVDIEQGTGNELLENALAAKKIQRRIVVQLPGFLGLGAMLSATDLVATLPRQTGETLAHSHGLRVLPCPFPIPAFTVKQHWHTRYHNDVANRWLRAACAALFLRERQRP